MAPLATACQGRFWCTPVAMARCSGPLVVPTVCWPCNRCPALPAAPPAAAFPACASRERPTAAGPASASRACGTSLPPPSWAAYSRWRRGGEGGEMEWAAGENGTPGHTGVGRMWSARATTGLGSILKVGRAGGGALVGDRGPVGWASREREVAGWGCQGGDTRPCLVAGVSWCGSAATSPFVPALAAYFHLILRSHPILSPTPTPPPRGGASPPPPPELPEGASSTTPWAPPPAAACCLQLYADFLGEPLSHKAHRLLVGGGGGLCALGVGTGQRVAAGGPGSGRGRAVVLWVLQGAGPRAQ